MRMHGVSGVASQQQVSGEVQANGHLRRAPLVGMDLLHGGAISGSNRVARAARLKAKDLISLLLGHYAADAAAVSAARPRVSIRMNVLTPAGKLAVKVKL